MLFVNAIAQLNAQAIDLMHQGQSNRAISLLVAAITDLHSFLSGLNLRASGNTGAIVNSGPLILLLQQNSFQQSRQQQLQQGSTPTSLIGTEAVLSTNIEECGPGESTPPSSLLGFTEGGGSSDLPAYYSRPFEIVPQAHNQVIPNALIGGTLAEMSAVLLFNLGMTRHRQGINSGSSACLQAALQLYDQALAELEMVAMSVSTTVNNMLSEHLVLLSAIHQNKALIYMSFWDAVEAKQEIQWMTDAVGHLEVALITPRAAHGGVIPASLSEDLHFFRLQLAFLKMYDFKFATAA